MNFIHFTGVQNEAPFMAIFLTIVGFISYYTIIKSKAISSLYSHTNFIYFSRIMGFLLLGIIPFMVFYFFLTVRLDTIGIAALNLTTTSILLLIGLSVISIIISFFLSKKTTNLNVYPQIRSVNWRIATFLFSSFTWIAYLIAYEFLFRGILLFTCKDAFGTIPALAINIMMYALAHIPKGIHEILGAIPVGLILCLVTLATGTIWTALGIHIVMALSNEWFSFYHHPTMHLILQKKQR